MYKYIIDFESVVYVTANARKINYAYLVKVQIAYRNSWLFLKIAENDNKHKAGYL